MADSIGCFPGQRSAAKQSGDTRRPETLLTGDFAGTGPHGLTPSRIRELDDLQIGFLLPTRDRIVPTLLELFRRIPLESRPKILSQLIALSRGHDRLGNMRPGRWRAAPGGISADRTGR